MMRVALLINLTLHYNIVSFVADYNILKTMQNFHVRSYRGAFFWSITFFSPQFWKISRGCPRQAVAWRHQSNFYGYFQSLSEIDALKFILSQHLHNSLPNQGWLLYFHRLFCLLVAYIAKTNCISAWYRFQITFTQ